MNRRNIVSVAMSDPERDVCCSIPARTDSERIRMLIRKLMTGEWIPETGDPRKKRFPRRGS